MERLPSGQAVPGVGVHQKTGGALLFPCEGSRGAGGKEVATWPGQRRTLSTGAMGTAGVSTLSMEKPC
jgi:hypothetical protein